MAFVCSLLVLAIILLPKILISMCVLKDIADKPFVCPNCGCRFYVKWHRLYLKHIAINSFGTARLRCPSCRITDICRHDDK